MAAFNKFQCFVADVANKVHNLGSDVLKIMLTNTAPAAVNTVKANLAELAPGNGYTAGGNAVAITASSQTGGVYKLVGSDVVFIASGGTIGPFQYAVLYNSTAAAGPLISWWDRGSPVTLANGESFAVDLDQVGGILTIT